MSRCDAEAADPEPEAVELIAADPAALAAALARALAGRQALVRRDEAAPGAPEAPALREGLRLSAAHIERLLARLAAVEPPRPSAAHRGTRDGAGRLVA